MTNYTNKELIVIAGPTAVGKTSYAIELAQKYQTEILSADSRQFYRELQIGTAAPSKEELAAAPHHFIGNLSIHDYYNVSMYEQEAMRLIDELFQKHDKLIVVGGSGLYIDALCFGIDELPDADESLRSDIKRRYAEEGIEYLQKEVARLDPDFYKIVDQNNHKRLQRALEVCLATGKTYSSQRTNKKKSRPFKIQKLVLNMERELLYERINKRVDLMMEAGLLNEVKSLLPFRELNALKTVGYTELFRYLDGDISLEQAVTDIKTNSRRYSKRQVTWFKRYDDFEWIMR
jgi:tRNA dimethylallyltransferase